MNTKIVYGIAIIIAVIGGVWYISSDKSSSQNVNREGQEMTVEDGIENSENSMKMKEAGHEDDELVMEAKNDKGMMEAKDNKMMMEVKDSMMKVGSYEPYDALKLSMAKNGKMVFFFKASWCPSCRVVDKDIKESLSDIPDGVTILEVDYDKETALKQKYGVTTQHTFVQVDADGNEITKWVGSNTLEEVVNKLK